MIIDFINEIITFPNNISDTSILILILVSFISSLISSIMGFGGGILLLGILATIIPATMIIPIHALAQTGSNLNRLFIFKFNVFWPIIIPFTIGCLIGVPLGGIIIFNISEELILILIGLFILFGTWGKLSKFNTKKLFVGSILSSFLSTIVGASGVIISMIVQTFELQKTQYISTCAFLLLTQHVLKCIIFGILGFSLKPYISLIALIIISGFFGTIIGKKLVLKINDILFKKIINLFLIIISINLIYKGFSNLL